MKIKVADYFATSGSDQMSISLPNNLLIGNRLYLMKGSEVYFKVSWGRLILKIEFFLEHTKDQGYYLLHNASDHKYILPRNLPFFNKYFSCIEYFDVVDANPNINSITISSRFIFKLLFLQRYSSFNDVKIFLRRLVFKGKKENKNENENIPVEAANVADQSITQENYNPELFALQSKKHAEALKKLESKIKVIDVNKLSKHDRYCGLYSSRNHIPRIRFSSYFRSLLNCKLSAINDVDDTDSRITYIIENVVEDDNLLKFCIMIEKSLTGKKISCVGDRAYLERAHRLQGAPSEFTIAKNVFEPIYKLVGTAKPTNISFDETYKTLAICFELDKTSKTPYKFDK